MLLLMAEMPESTLFTSMTTVLKHVNVLTHCSNGAESQISGYTGASHKLCRTMSQADAFIEDWKNVVADGYRTAIKKLLDDGIRPGDMKIEKRAKDMLFKDYTLNEGANTMEPEPLET